MNVFGSARRLRPELARVGVVWNPSEANSEAQLKLARGTCQSLGIDLIEAAVDTSAAVAEAANALAARGAEAIWAPGDVTVLAAVDGLLQAARKARIPVFTVIPPHAERGALFDLGANYYEVGRQTGYLAGEILAGRDPASVSIDNLIPEILVLNKQALQPLKETWRFPEEVLRQATILIDESGRKQPGAGSRPAGLSKRFRVHLIEYNDVLDVEEAEQGVVEGLQKAGLTAGRDYELKIRNAQGDMATVTSLVDAAVTDQADLIITLSTPTLQAALRRAGGIPVVFTYCANAVAAGAGRTDSDHLPNVTGVQTSGAYDELAAVVRECLPRARVIGTLFVPSEVNSVYHKKKFAEAARKSGLEMIAVAAETSAEVPNAAQALCNRGLDAVCQIPGNLTAAAFPSIARAAQKAGLPLFATQRAQAQAGAAVVVARDYHDAGLEAAALAVRVMRGESPGSIPFQTVSRTRIIINKDGADACGLKIPASLLNRAGEIIRQRNTRAAAPRVFRRRPAIQIL